MYSRRVGILALRVASFSTKEMSEIIIRCVVLAPVSEG